LKANISLKIDGKALKKDIIEKIISCSFTDNIDFKSDQLTLRFDDSKDELKIPKIGQNIELFTGYEKLIKQGSYVIDRVSLDTKGITVYANGYSNLSDAKRLRERSIKPGPLSSILDELSKEIGLYSTISPEIFKITTTAMTTQKNESNLSLMFRLCDMYNLFLKIHGDKILFKEKLAFDENSGKSKRSFIVKKSDTINFSYDKKKSKAYSKFEAQVQNVDTGIEKIVSIGQGKTLRSRKIFKSENEALEELEKLKSKKSFLEESITIEITSNPLLKAGFYIDLQDFKSQLNDIWLITNISSSIAKSYKSVLRLERSSIEAK